MLLVNTLRLSIVVRVFFDFQVSLYKEYVALALA